MRNKLSITTLAAAFSLMLIFSVGASAQKTDCTKVTDNDLVKELYAKIMTKYSSQVSHINVRASGKVITIEGWVTTKSVKKEIEKWAKKIKCAKVVNNLTIGVGGGCGPGQKVCGDICIPEKETCNLCRGIPCTPAK